MTKSERRIYDRERRLANLEKYNLNNIMEANHYINLQPLWAKENFIKSDSYHK